MIKRIFLIFASILLIPTLIYSTDYLLVKESFPDVFEKTCEEKYILSERIECKAQNKIFDVKLPEGCRLSDHAKWCSTLSRKVNKCFDNNNGVLSDLCLRQNTDYNSKNYTFSLILSLSSQLDEDFTNNKVSQEKYIKLKLILINLKGYYLTDGPREGILHLIDTYSKELKDE